MRTTVNVPDELLAEAKAAAVREHTTLTRLVEEGLRLRLRRAANGERLVRVELPVCDGRGGFTAAVTDSLSNQALYDAADDEAFA